MFLSNASVRRPVAMCCLIIALALLGVNAYRTMGIEWLPKVDVPYITVVTVYPGGSPSEIESDIARPIEEAVVSLDGLKYVTSSCMENVCQTLIEFDLDMDVDVAANDVREKIDLITNDFPSGTEKPNVLKFDINAQPIITLALAGDAPLADLYDYADNTLKDRLTTLSGVAEVDLIGGAEREVHVVLDRKALAARGLTSMDVVQAVQEGVRMIPSGRVREQGAEYAVKFDADYETTAELGTLELANSNGQRCYIHDVGRVAMTTEEQRQAAYVDGQPCIGIKVVKKADANAVAVVDRVREAIAEMRTLLPGGMELVWVTDDAQFVEASVNTTLLNILQGIALTALILFFFFYNLRLTMIVAVTMPLTILIGLFFMSFLDYTLNVSTLLAIGLSVGILVTNSIVVLESIGRRFAENGDAKEASRLGARAVAMAVLASAGTNVVVLFPVATMGTMVGLFFAPFAITMVIMTLASLFISFTLTPILCSVLLRKDQNDTSLLRRMEQSWNRLFDAITRNFAHSMHFFEHRRLGAMLGLAAAVAIFCFSLGIVAHVGLDFFPVIDKGEVFVKLEYPTRYALDRTTERVREVERMVQDMPGLEHMFTTVGKVDATVGRSSEGVYLAQVVMKFVDKTERDTPIAAILTQVREQLAHYPECMVTVGQPSEVGGQSTPIELTISGADLDTLDTLALRVQDLSQGVDGIVEPDTTVRFGKPELRIRPQRAVLADLDIAPANVGLALRANIEGLESGVFKSGDRNYDIVVKLEEQEGTDQIEEFLFPGAPGHPLVLTTLAQVESGEAPVQITRRNKQRISKLFADLDGPMGTVVQNLSARIDEEADLPPGYDYEFVGEYELMQEGNEAMAEAGIIALILVYLVLAAILESFLQPFIILVTIPLGLIGMLWALGLAGEAINMFVLLGAVMLIGIVVNNAILIMDRVNGLRHEGAGRREAMAQAAAERFRPIVMITLAAVLGMLPLALGAGIGSEMRTPIGIAAVGGILVSALLTLLVLPMVYYLFSAKDSKDDHSAS
ncbi:MAG: efflux RND transporter permease subunit [Candidatus Hydrogenedentota bacterium]